MKKLNYILLISVISLVGKTTVSAQGANFSNMFVGGDTELHIQFANNVVFNSNVKTDRGNAISNVSFITVPELSNISGYVDGKVKVYQPIPSSVFATGHLDTPSYVNVSTVNNNAVTAVYNKSSYGNTAIDNDIFLVSESEHWIIEGNGEALITIGWSENSSYASMANNWGLNEYDLTVVAWDGAKWIALPSALSGTLNTTTQGKISTASTVDLSTYSVFTLAFKNNCGDIVSATGSVVYNNSWSAQPDQFTDATINTPFTVTPETSFTVNNLVLNADVVIEDGAFIEVVNGVTGTGHLIIANEGSFMQRANSQNVPNIVLTKKSRPVKKYDYVYWGTPIQQNFVSQIANAKVENYNTPAFNASYKYVSEAGTQGSWQPLTEIVPGKGFITRVNAQPPFANATDVAVVDFPIEGTANNGNVQVTLGSATTGSRSFNLLANPYPSAIDAGEFLRANPNVGGAVYLWTANEYNSMAGTADYAVWTLAGTVATSPISQNPLGYIASGQSFMVKGLVGGGQVNFTNCMRVNGNNNNFFRTAEQAYNRYWLNLTNDDGKFSQILINYSEDATYEYDRLYDAPRNSVSTAQLYSFIGTDKYAVNSRPVFDAEDIVPLGVSRTEAEGSSFTIALHQPEGIFETNDVTIYLLDKYLGIYHNLNQGDYTFNVSGLNNNERFEVVYQDASLGTNNPNFALNNAVMFINKGAFNITASDVINNVKIYDLTGRLITTYKTDADSFTAPFAYSQGIYVAIATLNNGITVTQKLVNGN